MAPSHEKNYASPPKGVTALAVELILISSPPKSGIMLHESFCAVAVGLVFFTHHCASALPHKTTFFLSPFSGLIFQRLCRGQKAPENHALA